MTIELTVELTVELTTGSEVMRRSGSWAKGVIQRMSATHAYVRWDLGYGRISYSSLQVKALKPYSREEARARHNQWRVKHGMSPLPPVQPKTTECDGR